MLSLELEPEFGCASCGVGLRLGQPINYGAHRHSRNGKLMEMTKIRAASITAFRIVSRFLSEGGL